MVGVVVRLAGMVEPLPECHQVTHIYREFGQIGCCRGRACEIVPHTATRTFHLLQSGWNCPYYRAGKRAMSVQLTPDELREVVLAIDAYKEALERFNATGSVGSSIRALQTAREKINRECRRVETSAAEQ
jgi:hypothetical protein